MTTLLERRRIEADFARRIYDELAKELGAEKARALLSRMIARAAREAGAAFAGAKAGRGSLEVMADAVAMWQEGGALEVQWLNRSPERLEFNVTRCRYAEMYRELGIAHLGSILSCSRDGGFCEGVDARIRLNRTHTIQDGAPYCDFRYWIHEEGQ